MSKISEIIKSGRMNLAFGAPDPTSCDVAVPKAIKECFDTGYKHQRGKRPIRDEEIFQSIGYSKKVLKNTWSNL